MLVAVMRADAPSSRHIQMVSEGSAFALFLHMILEMLYACLSNTIHHNAHLVYALLLHRNLLANLRQRRRYRSLIAGIEQVRPHVAAAPAYCRVPYVACTHTKACAHLRMSQLLGLFAARIETAGKLKTLSVDAVYATIESTAQSLQPSTVTVRVPAPPPPLTPPPPARWHVDAASSRS